MPVNVLGRVTAFKVLGYLIVSSSLLAEGKWCTSGRIYNVYAKFFTG